MSQFRLHEVLGPFVIQAPGDAFSAAQLSDTVFTTQAIQNYAYFLLRTELLARLAVDVTNALF